MIENEYDVETLIIIMLDSILRKTKVHMSEEAYEQTLKNCVETVLKSKGISEENVEGVSSSVRNRILNNPFKPPL